MRTSHRLCLPALLLAVALSSGWPPAAPAPRPRPARGDEVARDLREFRRETSPKRRADLVKRFGRRQDARVALALMEVVLEAQARDWDLGGQGEAALLLAASYALVHHHIPEKDLAPAKYWTVALLWWERNEADVRRRANALPK